MVSGSYEVSDDGGHVTLDVDPGGTTLVALIVDSVVGPTVTVDSGTVGSAELHVP